jgi:hypothetical protein
VYTYHVFMFYSVLRLEKYPMVFSAQADHTCSLFVPLARQDRLYVTSRFST